MQKLRNFFLLVILLLRISSESQTRSFAPGHFAPQNFLNSDDVFGCRTFIENRGQYPAVNGKEVLYVLDNAHEKIYFTDSGLIYEIKENPSQSKEDFEELEHGKIPEPLKVNYVSMTWQRCNANIVLEPHEKQSHYMTYGAAEFNAHTYKKITYLNVYDGIDIEYVIPTDKKSGVKYSVILNPKSDVSDLQIAYSGDVSKIFINDKKEIVIRSPLADIIEHSPRSFYENGEEILSQFVIRDAVISYSLATGLISERKVIIDPWVSTTNQLLPNSAAFDVDYDFQGRTYVYGGFNPFKVACYNVSGSLLWVFMGTLVAPVWSSSPFMYNAGNFGVNKHLGKTYIGQGFSLLGATVIRLDAGGNYDHFMSQPNSIYQEVWDMGFYCTSAEVFTFGGSTTSNATAATLDTSTALMTISAFQGFGAQSSTVSTINNGQDIVSHAIDGQGNIFVIYAGHPTVSNKISLIAPSFTTNTWLQPSTYTVLTEAGNKSYYQGVSLNSNGFNCLAANESFLFYYDGKHLAAYDKQNGGLVASTSITTLTLLEQGGIAVDDCNNLYLGGKGTILCFKFNGTTFSALPPIAIVGFGGNKHVYDIKLDKYTKTLYACGNGFVGVLTPMNTMACPTASSICSSYQTGITVSSNNISCITPGSATCAATGGIGPFSYTWIPSNQTSSVASNLSPGAHQIIVHDIGANNTYTATTYISPMIPLTGSVPNPVNLPCGGFPNGTASVSNLTGGSGKYSYVWSDGVNTQTTATAYNLSVGNYTVSVTDSLTNCVWIQGFSTIAPPALTLALVSSATVACAHTNISLLGLVTGGSPQFTYSWTAGPQSSKYLVTEPQGGTYVYTLNTFDSKNCVATKTVQLVFIPAPTITVNNANICPGKSATLTAGGALSYTWSTGSLASSIVGSPISTTTFTVSGTGSLCVGSSTAQITVLSLPIPTLSSNSPVCENLSLELKGSGGTTYAWSGPNGFSSTASEPSISVAMPVHSGIYTATVTAANSCTASSTLSVTVHAAPGLSATGSSVCVTSPVQLTATSQVAGVTYSWTGPESFTSSLQNPVISKPTEFHSGSYTVMVTDSNSCSSKAVVHVTVSTMPTASITTNSPVCENSFLVLDGSISKDALSFTWSGPNNYQSSLANPTLINVKPGSAGVYVLTVTRGACVDSVAANVIIHVAPQLSVNLLPSKICITKSFSLELTTSSGVTSYSWKGPNNFSSQSKNVQRDSSSIGDAGLYTVTILDTNLCTGSAAQQVTILKNPVLTAADVAVCLYSPATLIGSGATNYSWTGPSFSGSGATVVIPQASNTHPATYTLVASDTNQCVSEKTLLLTTYPLPQPSLYVTPGPVLCVDDQVNFTGDGGINYEWQGPQNFYYKTRIVDFICTNLNFSGIYTLTVEDKNGCRAITSTTLLINKLPGGSLLGSREGCVPLCSPLFFSPSSETVKSIWKTSQVIHTSPSFTVCFQEPGRYELTGHLSDTATGCHNTMSFQINAFRKPEASFVFDPMTPSEYDEVHFRNTTLEDDISDFSWFVNEPGGYTANTRDAGFMFTEEGSYPVVLVAINNLGCADTSIQEVVVLPEFHLFVPNAFTPNGDDRNDIFLPVTQAPRNYHLMLFDRWGSLMFESEDPIQGWDGSYKGQPCKDDSYTWKIKLTNRKGETKEFSGHVILLK